MDLEYEQMGDYLIPKLKANPEPEGMVTKYGLLRDKFLRERYDGARTAMFLEGTLKAHLLEIQEQANKNGSTLKKNSNINFSTKKVGGKKKNWQSNKPAISRKMQNIGLPALR